MGVFKSKEKRVNDNLKLPKVIPEFKIMFIGEDSGKTNIIHTYITK